jgi:hypothetical protein
MSICLKLKCPLPPSGGVGVYGGRGSLDEHRETRTLASGASDALASGASDAGEASVAAPGVRGVWGSASGSSNAWCDHGSSRGTPAWYPASAAGPRITGWHQANTIGSLGCYATNIPTSGRPLRRRNCWCQRRRESADQSPRARGPVPGFVGLGITLLVWRQWLVVAPMWAM